MNILAEILSSRVKAEIFRLLFSGAVELHLRELGRRSGFSVSTVRQEIARLTRLGLVESRASGNRVYYRACTRHPLFHDLRSLVLKTSGLADVLRDALKTLNVRLAFVFGSVASASEGAHSDVDLLVVGKVSLRELSGTLADASQVIGREVNPIAMSREEFRRRNKKRDHFLTTVLSAPKLFVVGDEHELERMGELRVASAAPAVSAGNPRTAANRRP